MRLHERERDYDVRTLKGWLMAPLSRTHHAPSYRSEAPFHSGSPLTLAFCSDLDALIESSGVPLWIHGHTHYNVDYQLGSTRVLSNQFGYPDEPCKDFDPALVVEIGTPTASALTS